jgi:hypothetical protein
MPAQFTMNTYQNEYLPAGGSEMHAIVTVTCDAGASMNNPTSAEVVIVDVSGSMNAPRTKIRAARDATAAAIDCIRDGVLFGVLAGSDDAEQLYPPWGPLLPADEDTRAAAKNAVRKLKAGGGTAIGEWLKAANSIFSQCSADINHAILLTDGEDEGESLDDLDRAISESEGRFQCDCRGVGTDWRVSELRRIASALLGTVDIIASPDEMARDFAVMMQSAMAKSVADVRLRLWVPQGASVAFVKQVAPSIEDLSARAFPVNDLTCEYPTGAWGNESRDYHVCVCIPARGLDEEALAARVSLVIDDAVASQSLVKATWTDDRALSTRINREVAHYTGQAELAESIQAGLNARRAGDDEQATMRLGRAVQLAAESGNDGTMKLLAAVVDIDDAVTGTVRLKREITDADDMTLDTRSTKTTRIEVTE